MGLGAEISNDRIRSLRIGDVEVSGSGNLNTAANVARYPLMVERAAPLVLNMKVKKSAILAMEGEDNLWRKSLHHFL